MRWTHTLIPTLKELPAGAPNAELQLLARAGLVRQVGGGTLTFLPLGLRSVHKLAMLVREELGGIGCGEARLPADDAAVATLVGSCIRSYKQLPLCLYQIGPSLRDEQQPRSGLPQVREQFLAEAYSFDATESGCEETFSRTLAAWGRVLARCKLQFLKARARNGRQFVVRSAAGEERIAVSDRDDYAASIEAAETGPRPWAFASEPAAPLEQVHTPGLASIQEVCDFLHIPPRQMLKALVFQATSPIPVNWVVAVVRGDHQVNEWKLARAAEAMGVTSLRLVDSPEVRQKFAVGYVGPDAGTKVPDAVLIVDPDAAQGQTAWAAGANEIDFHVRNFNWFRDAGDRLADPAKVMVADIRNAVEGDPSPKPGGVLAIHNAIEIGSASKLGAGLAEKLGAMVDDESGRKQPMWIGNYRLDLGRVLAAVVESSHDEHGIIWPAALAPCSVVLTPIKYEGRIKEAADQLYTRLTFEGIDVILDDREARAGFKFADADLIGFPVRINIGDKNLQDGRVEMKLRSSSVVDRIALDDVIAQVRAAFVD